MLRKLAFNLSKRTSFLVPCLSARDHFQSGSRSQYVRSAEPPDILAADEWSYRMENDKDIGITVFLSQHKGFSGKMQRRYSDFLINEINSEKEIVELTNLGFCQKNTLNFFKVVPHLHKDLSNPLFNAFEGKVLEETEINVSALNDNEIDDLCETLKRVAFNIDVRKMTNALGRTIVLNCGVENCYTHFTLFKKNLSHATAVDNIVKTLQVRKEDVAHCGIKDRRGVTCQKMSIRNVQAEILLDLNLRLNNIKIGGVYYDSKPITGGDLYGNRFTIVLRDVDAGDDIINTAMQNFRDSGFINYYGMQRFTTTGLPTLLIGKKILAREWKSAVEIIIKPWNRKMLEDVLMCRTLWWETRDAEAALKCLRLKRTQLAKLLKGLLANGNDYEKALACYSADHVRYFLYSYSSYVWNNVVSRRIEELGTSPIVGDLIIPANAVKESQLQVVTPEMLANNTITMYNLVLPLLGHNVVLPNNIVADWYKEFLAKDGLTISSFQSDKVLYNIAAGYRHLLSRPENVSWSCLNYNSATEKLLETDYNKYVEGIALHPLGGNRRALKMQFSLTSSSYPASALREIVHKSFSEMSTVQFQ